MPQHEQKDNEGVLFKNDKKQTDKHPDYRGEIVVNGTTYWLSAWINEARQSGQKYMKLNVKPKDDTDQRRYDQGGAPTNEDDVPF
jgi:uncharacterized protein (DUF736 family)